jgi:hypothetical protein
MSDDQTERDDLLSVDPQYGNAKMPPEARELITRLTRTFIAGAAHQFDHEGIDLQLKPAVLTSAAATSFCYFIALTIIHSTDGGAYGRALLKDFLTSAEGSIDQMVAQFERDGAVVQ